LPELTPVLFLLGAVTPMPGAQNLSAHLGNTFNTTA
jgi:hypothetical protein